TSAGAAISKWSIWRTADRRRHFQRRKRRAFVRARSDRKSDQGDATGSVGGCRQGHRCARLWRIGTADRGGPPGRMSPRRGQRKTGGGNSLTFREGERWHEQTQTGWACAEKPRQGTNGNTGASAKPAGQTAAE